ncbi:apolipoprotein acyltransferase [Stieleria sp. TO1_6]|uniref:apolipoprotein acyltransferase n=1 Tax=Stieleria tagensis TaxID=2956795 RepID=UPI00209B62B7|nr:apolipoprotein acyltransferase [Stieleria tagensis]MCO8122282.1 apolipoprotein acyltransferase [Stieleria tagensis]
MPTSIFLKRCQELAAQLSPPPVDQGEPAPESSESESLIGFFQLFRPRGDHLGDLLETLPAGDQLADRMQLVFDVAGDDRRPQGGRDAFFIVRQPAPLPVEQAEHHALSWIDGLRQIALAVGDQEMVDGLDQPPKIRVLEGIPPKHPKQPEEQSPLLKLIQNRGAELTAEISNVDPHAALLRPAYYFVACDTMLRDYLMWPLYAVSTGLADPLRGYFQLWAHGVKYRVFRNDQIDLYLPRLN